MCKIGHSSALCGRELVRRELACFLIRPVTIATPVNKPREAQSLRELPALRPSGGAQSFWP